MPILVYGHRRSGNNFLAAALGLNIAGPEGREYLNGYTHKPAREAIKYSRMRLGEVTPVHIWRNFNDVAKSLWVMKARFGINTHDFEAFLSQPYKDSYLAPSNTRVTCQYADLTTGEVVKNRTGGGWVGLRNITQTPVQYWATYINEWFNTPGVIHISYDSLTSNYIKTMHWLLRRLGKPAKKIVRVEKRVGWMAKD